MARGLNNLGATHVAQERYDEAESILLKALEVRQNIALEHPDVANSFNNLGLLYQGQRRFSEAELYFQRSLTIREHRLGCNHPITQISQNNLSVVQQLI